MFYEESEYCVSDKNKTILVSTGGQLWFDDDQGIAVMDVWY